MHAMPLLISRTMFSVTYCAAEGPHRSVVAHSLYQRLSFLGVLDHRVCWHGCQVDSWIFTFAGRGGGSSIEYALHTNLRRGRLEGGIWGTCTCMISHWKSLRFKPLWYSVWYYHFFHTIFYEYYLTLIIAVNGVVKFVLVQIRKHVYISCQ